MTSNAASRCSNTVAQRTAKGIVACLGFYHGRRCSLHCRGRTCVCGAGVSSCSARTAYPDSRPCPVDPPPDRTLPSWRHRHRPDDDHQRRRHRRSCRPHLHRSVADLKCCRRRRHRCVCNPIADNYRLHRKAHRKQHTTTTVVVVNGGRDVDTGGFRGFNPPYTFFYNLKHQFYIS